MTPPEPRRLDPDPLDVQPVEPNPRPRPVVGPSIDRSYSAAWGCGTVLAALGTAFLILLAGCSAQPAGNATPQAQKGGEHHVKSATGLHVTEPAVASAASESSAASSADLASTPAPPLTPEVLAGGTTYSGIVNYAEPGLGRWYLAIPDGKGVAVTICGPGGCLDRVSTDAGPDLAMQRAGRIADLNSVDWLAISGVPLKYGGFQGTILIVKRPPRIELPQTDSLEGP